MAALFHFVFTKHVSCGGLCFQKEPCLTLPRALAGRRQVLGAPAPQALASGTGTRALNSSTPPVDADAVCSENAWQLELEFGQNEFSIEVLAPALAAAQVKLCSILGCFGSKQLRHHRASVKGADGVPTQLSAKGNRVCSSSLVAACAVPSKHETMISRGSKGVHLCLLLHNTTALAGECSWLLCQLPLM